MDDPYLRQSHCVFEYLYRDASNYKAHGALLLRGEFNERDRALIVGSLIDGIYFLPNQVGLAALPEELYAYSGGPTEDDHAWHEFVELRPADAEDMARLSVADTLEGFVADPGIKLEGASTDSPKTKRRSQFRIKSKDLGSLYQKISWVDSCE